MSRANWSDIAPRWKTAHLRMLAGGAGPDEHAVAEAALFLLASHQKITDRTSLGQVARHAGLWIEPGEVSRHRRRRVGQILTRLDELGVLTYEPLPGRGGCVIGLPESDGALFTDAAHRALLGPRDRDGVSREPEPRDSDEVSREPEPRDRDGVSRASRTRDSRAVSRESGAPIARPGDRGGVVSREIEGPIARPRTRASEGSSEVLPRKNPRAHRSDRTDGAVAPPPTALLSAMSGAQLWDRWRDWTEDHIGGDPMRKADWRMGWAERLDGRRDALEDAVASFERIRPTTLREAQALMADIALTYHLPDHREDPA